MTNGTAASRIVVHHVKICSLRPAEQAHERLMNTLPRLDPNLAEMLRRGDAEAVARERRDGPPLWLFEVRNMGSLMAIEGGTARVYQYEIGNPLTAESMLRHQAGAGLYAPLRVVLYEEQGGSVFAFDRPSDLFGQFGDARVTEVARELDHELEAALRRAAD
jgi:hypothetical protein